MKRVLLFLLVLAAALLPSLALAVPGVAYYMLDETSGTTAADSWGTYPGTLNGGCTWVPGHTNNGVQLNGTTGCYISLPNNLTTSLNDFTIACWVKLNANLGWNRIFDFGSGPVTFMCLTPSAGGGAIRFTIKYNNSAEQQVNGTAALPIGSWQFVTVTLSGSTGRLYVNAAQVGTNTGMTLKPSSLGTLTQVYIGKSQFNDPYFNGIIDEFQIYGRALSAAEITGLYNGTPLTTHTIAASAGAGGTISPSGAVVVADGESQTFTITPNFAYAVASVLVDGVSQGAITSYTFSSNAADHTIAVSFSASPTVSLSGTVTVNGVPTGAATVSLYSDAACTQLAATAPTASDGSYTFPAVPQDTTCHLKATQSGYAPTAVLTVAVGPMAVSGVDLVLDSRRYEAEDPANTRANIGANVADSGASGGFRVGKASQGTYGGVTFNNITAATHGMYAMTLRWFGFGDTRRTGVAVNGIAVSGSPFLCQTGGYNSTVISVPLNAGSNTIAIYAVANDWGPQWDYIDIPAAPTGDFYTITSSAGANGAISPVGLIPVVANGNQTFTITPSLAYQVADVLVDGASVGAVTTYTFSNVTANGHTISASFAAKPTYAVSGTVTNSVTLDPIAGAKVYVSTTANASVSPLYTLTTDASGNYSVDLFDATWYVCASATGYTTSVDTSVSVAGVPMSAVDFPLVPSGRNIPAMDKLMFALYAQDLTVNGATTNPWPAEHPKGKTLTAIANPTLTTVDTVQWEQNSRDDGDGYSAGVYAAGSPPGIPAAGATITAVVQPTYWTGGGERRGEIVDVFYGELYLAVAHDNGEVQVCTRGYQTRNTGYMIPAGQKTILTMVVSQAGVVEVYANGLLKYTWATGVDYSTLQWHGTASVISVGRNGYDGWSSFHGKIGAALLWKTALTPGERIGFESDLGATFGITLPTYHNITASAGAGGTITPSGVVPVIDGGNQTFTFSGSLGHMLSDVKIDGVSDPVALAAGTYTFNAVTTTHTIEAVTTTVAVHTVTGRVMAGGNPVVGDVVSINTVPAQTFTTLADGQFSFSVNQGSYTVTVGPKFPYAGATRAADASSASVPLGDIVLSAVQPLVDVRAADVPAGSVASWSNIGSLGGVFVPTGSAPVVAAVGGKRAISFTQTPMQLQVGGTAIDAPASILGSTTVTPKFTMSAWIYRSDISDSPTWGCGYLSWTAPQRTAWMQYGLGGYGHSCDGWGSGYPGVQYGGACPPAGSWYHFVVTNDGSRVTTWITNPAGFSQTQTVTGTGYYNVDKIYIGEIAPSQDGGRKFIGGIASLQIFDIPVTAGDLAGLDAIAPPIDAVTYTVTASAGTGGTVTPAGVTTVIAGGSLTYTIAPAYGYSITDVLVDGSSVGAVSTYTFSALAANHTIAVSFTENLKHTISGKVTNSATGANIVGATVYFSTTPNAFVSPFDTATTDGSGNYTKLAYDGPIYVSASASGYYNSADKPVNLTADVTGINFSMVSNTRHTPVPDQLLFSALTDVFPNSGPTGNWATDVPVGGTLTQINNPTVAIVNGQKWDNNIYTANNGYNFGAFTDPIPCTGVTVVAVVSPTLRADGGWGCVFNAFYNDLMLNVNQVTGASSVVVKGNWHSGPVIPAGVPAVLSAVVTATGGITLYVNGAAAMTATATSGSYTQITPGGWSAGEVLNGTMGFAHNINVGRNAPDGWSTYNGKIGDVFVYKTALTDAQRAQLESDLFDKFSIGGTAVTITGKVMDANNGNAGVPGAQVVVQVGGADVPTVADLTDSSGNYTAKARLNVGDLFTVHATKLNFLAGDSDPAVLFDGSTTIFSNVDVLVASISTVNISGSVTDFISGDPVGGIKLLVSVPDISANYNVTTESDGSYSVAVAAGNLSYIINLDPTNSPLPAMLTDLATRTITSPDGLYIDVTGMDLLVSYPSTISGRVVTSDASSPAGFVVAATDEFGGVTSATTALSGAYSLTVLPGYYYTVTAKKSGYVTMPGPQAVNVGAGNTDYPLGDFTAIPTTISGVVTDATTGLPVYNAVVQTGGPGGGNSVVTNENGTYSLPGTGCGGVELFGDAMNYHCKNYLVTGSGAVTKNIPLVEEAETGVIVNGEMEDAFTTDWVALGASTFNQSTTARHGLSSLWYTSATAYTGVRQDVQLTPGYTYTWYMRAKADLGLGYWQPLFEFTNDLPDTDPGYIWDGYVSAEPGYTEWFHAPPRDWYTYLKWFDRGNTHNGPAVRVTPPAGATKCTWIFLIPEQTPMPDPASGAYVDSAVIDKVAVDEPLVTVAPDSSEPPTTDVANLAALKAQVGQNVKLTGVVTVVSKGNGLFFVGEERYKGTIKVAANGHAIPASGSFVTTLKGLVSVDAFGQYTLTLSADPAAAGSGNVIAAMGMNNKVAKTDPKVLTGYVRVWGQVSGATIDDGYAEPITVKDASLGTGFVVINGVLWKDTDGSVVLYQDLP